jgi:nitroreductase
MFLELAKMRRSVRAYKKDAVEEEKLLQVLEAGRLAPTACNFQPFVFVVLRGGEVARLKNAYGREWFLNAPAAIVVCCDREKSWKRGDGKDYGDVDAAIAMDHMILAAAELGLGTCWIGAFNAEQASAALGLGQHIDPVVMTPLGYPAETPAARQRKKLDEIVTWG